MYISLFMCCIFIICIFFQRKSKIINTISIDNSNCIKGIMAICVVLHHLSGRTNLTGMFSDFGAIAVGCFFFISGYGLYTSYTKKGLAYFIGYPWNRFKKLIIPFIFCILLYQVIKFIFLKKLIFESILRGNVDWILPYSWYIFIAIIFYFVFYLTFKYSKKSFTGIFCCWIFTLFLFCLLVLLHWGGYWAKSLFLFPIGISYKYFEHKFINKSPMNILVIFCFILILIIALAHFDVKYKDSYIANLAPYIFILPLTTINISSLFFRFLGKISYEIYLVQGIIFLIMGHTVKLFEINSNYIFICLSLLFIIISAWLIKYLLDKMDSFWDKLKINN